MKKTIVLALALFVLSIHPAPAQIQKPVHWSYGTKKLPNGNLEVHLLASMDEGWHIYAQQQPKEALSTPTKIAFAKTPALTLLGQPLEKGKKELQDLAEVGIKQYYYGGKVDFVQQVKVKPGVTELKGKITFMACTDQMCLPEETIEFTVPIK